MESSKIEALLCGHLSMLFLFHELEVNKKENELTIRKTKFSFINRFRRKVKALEERGFETSLQRSDPY